MCCSIQQRYLTIVNGLQFKYYLQEIADHTFVISPPGNGYDCHRTWEALYIGATPIVWRTFSNIFVNVPVVVIGSVEELFDFMCRDNPPPSEESTRLCPKLFFGYWRDLILGACEDLC